MSLFLLTFFLIYGSFHVYVLLKAKAAFHLGATTSIGLSFFMLCMILAPVIVRLSERAGAEVFARLLSYIGYSWLGLIFLFISVSLVLDLYRILVFGSGFVLQKNLSSVQISHRAAFLVPLILSIIISLYGYREAWDVQTEEVVIRSSKIPSEIGRLRIVQISDVHLGLIVREKRLEKIVRIAKQADPDVLVSTGDLVDGQIADLSGLSELLQNINPRYGKFAITGNHEFYAGITQSLHFTEKAGFEILRGETVTIKGLLNVAGVDDATGKSFGQKKNISEHDLLAGLPENVFTLLLKHRPVIDKTALGMFDLQLSGHTHKGQIFPFSIVTRMYYPVDSGCLNPADGCFLYVSRGSGTWGPPVRFLSRPEVTVIDLVHEGKKE